MIFDGILGDFSVLGPSFVISKINTLFMYMYIRISSAEIYNNIYHVFIIRNDTKESA